MKNKIFIYLVIILLPALLSCKIITLDEAIATALTRSIQLETELKSYKDQISSKKQSAYMWLPDASVGLDKNFNDGDWIELRRSFQLSWGISSNDSRYFNMKRQLFAMQQAEMSLEYKQKSIAWEVLNKYISVLQRQEMLDLKKEILTLEEKKLKKLQVKLELGEIDQIELDEAELNYLQSEIDYNEEQSSLQDARREFFHYINIEDDGLELGSLNLEIHNEPKPYQANLEYKMYEQNKLQAELNKKESFLQLMPVLSMNYNYSAYSNGDEISFGSADFDSYSVSLSLSYSIFDILDNLENYKTKRRNIAYTNLQLADIERTNREELDNLNSNMELQNRNYNLYIRKTELALRRLEKAQLQFDQGAISMLDLSDYQNVYYSSRKNEINEFYSALQTQESINLLLSDKILGKW